MDKILVNIKVEKKSGEPFEKLPQTSMGQPFGRDWRNTIRKFSDDYLTQLGYDISKYKKAAVSDDVTEINVGYYLKTSPEERFSADICFEGSVNVEVTASCIAEAQEKIKEQMDKYVEEESLKGFDMSEWWYHYITDSQGDRYPMHS